MPCFARPIIQSYRDLVVWKKSVALVLSAYRCTQAFPKSETYGLTSQLRRAAVSVPSNIAEGQARLSTGGFKQVLGNPRCSLAEVETQILIERELGYIDQNQCHFLIVEARDVGPILH